MRFVIDIVGFAVLAFAIVGFVRGLMRNEGSGRTDSGADAWIGDGDGTGQSSDGGGFGHGT